MADPIAEAFNLFDVNKDGFIDIDDLVTVVKEVSTSASPASALDPSEIREMVRLASGGSGTISLEDFRAFMGGSAPAFAPADQVKEAFSICADDPANPGKIGLDEATSTLANIGDKLTESELQKFVAEAQQYIEGDGNRVNFVKLADAWTKPESLVSVDE